MAYLNISAAAKNARAIALNNEVGGGAILRIYTGSPPAALNITATGTLLASMNCDSGAFGTVSNGIITVNPIEQTFASASGTAGYARVYKNDGITAVIDLDVSTTGASINLNTTAIVTGGPVAITVLTISEE